MIVRKGFDMGAALAMRKAMEAVDPSRDRLFWRKVLNAEFWGMYDPEPVGAVVLTGNRIHIACLRPQRCGFAARRILAEALKIQTTIFAPVKDWNEQAARFAQRLGFIYVGETPGWKLYGIRS